MSDRQTTSVNSAHPAARLGLFTGLLALTLSTMTHPAHAEDLDDLDLDELNERVEELEEDYEGELPEYTEAKESAEAAEEELEEINEELEPARERVSQLAAAQYKGSGLNPSVELMVSSSPDDMLEDASVLSHLSLTEGELVLELSDLQSESEAANENAVETLESAQELVDDLEDQRDGVLDRIAELEDVPAQSDSGSGGGNGTVPESAKGPGFDGVTPRMATVRDEIIMEFGAPYPVGCLRPGDSGDHGTGTACDFMMSSGGAMPSDANLALGDRISEYAIANADRLGVKYVIWKQRIYDTRTSGGWSQMGDRGSITANHFDHPHVSVF